MKTLKLIAAIASAIALTGCPTMQPSQPVPIYRAGPYSHPGSQMVFPENVGQFQRVQITQYAPSEKDVGVGYNLNNPDAPIVATVYVYPAPRVVSIGSPPDVVETAKANLFHGHLNALKNEIMAAHPDAIPISDDDYILVQAEQQYKGRKVTYEFAYTFGTQSKNSTSELYLFQSGPWLIKYRITFPKAASAKAANAIAYFLNELTWPQ